MAQFDIVDYWERINLSRRPVDYLTNFFEETGRDPPYPTVEHQLRAQQREFMANRFLEFGWRSLLDAGCGPGYWFQLWSRLRVSATGVDRAVASVAPAQAMNKTIGSSFPIVTAKLNDLPFKERQFDVAVTVKVLLHTPPDEIEPALKELGRVAPYLMLLERNSTNAPTRNHVFEHDIAGICDGLGFKVIRNQVFPDHQRFFIVKT